MQHTCPLEWLQGSRELLSHMQGFMHQGFTVAGETDQDTGCVMALGTGQSCKSNRAIYCSVLIPSLTCGHDWVRAAIMVSRCGVSERADSASTPGWNLSLSHRNHSCTWQTVTSAPKEDMPLFVVWSLFYLKKKKNMLSVYQMGELEIYTIFWWSILRQCLNKLNFSDITRSVQGITEGEICWKPQVNMKPWITAFCRTREHFGDPLARLEGMDGCSACPLKWALWPYPAASSQDKKDGWQPKATGYCRKAGFKLFHWVITWL